MEKLINRARRAIDQSAKYKAHQLAQLDPELDAEDVEETQSLRPERAIVHVKAGELRELVQSRREAGVELSEVHRAFWQASKREPAARALYVQACDLLACCGADAAAQDLKVHRGPEPAEPKSKDAAKEPAKK